MISSSKSKKKTLRSLRFTITTISSMKIFSRAYFKISAHLRLKGAEIILENHIPLLSWAFGGGTVISVGGQVLTQTAGTESELRFVQSPHSEHNYRQWAQKEPGQNIVFKRGG